MAKKQPTSDVPETDFGHIQADPAPDYTGDEHWGKGGRYVIDPKTGKRTPAEQYKPDSVNKPEELNNAD